MILDNPFHVVGLIANCGTRDKAAREAQIKRYLEVRKPLIFQDDLYFQGCRRNAGTVARALAALHDARDRIGPGLFWFTRGSVLDDHGLQLLIDGDLSGALEVWQRIEDRLPTRKYASSLNNLGTLYLLITLARKSPEQDWPSRACEPMEYLSRGLRAKARLVGDLSGPDLSSFCATFSDEMASRDANEIAAIFAESLEQFKGEAEKYGLELPIGDLGDLLDSGGPRTAALKDRFAYSLRQEIERSIRACRAAYSHDAANGAAAGHKLMAVAQNQLPELAVFLSNTEFAYTSLADRVADELLDASVAFFNDHSEADTVSLQVASSCASLERYAAEVACGVTVRGRAQENLDTTLEINRGLVEQQAMEGVRTPMLAWIERAGKMLRDQPRPDDQIAFVRQALVADGPGATTVIKLLGAIRRRGTKLFGRDFRKGNEMVQCGSVVCRILAAHAVSASNSAVRPGTKAEAALMLTLIVQHFKPASQDPGRDSEAFLVDDQSFNHLERNSELAISYLSKGENDGQGCMLGIAVGLLLLLLFWVTSCG